MSKPIFDAKRLSEKQRCKLIAKEAADGKVVGFIVEDDVKADRYLKRIQREAPKVIELNRVPGPVERTILVKVGLPSTDN